MVSAAGFFEYGELAVSAVLLVFGISLVVYLGRRGGFELALAHLVANRRNRAAFLWALCTSLAALFGAGLTASIDGLAGVPGSLVAETQTVLFVIGAGGILALMINSLRTVPLSLQEGWNLRENVERMTFTSSHGLLPAEVRARSVADDPVWPQRDP
jgi:hypothetical protein